MRRVSRIRPKRAPRPKQPTPCCSAPWALLDYGFRAIIAESFADIFFNNCFKNGILPIVLPSQVVDRLFAETLATPGYRLVVDLPNQLVRTPGGDAIPFDVDLFRK